MLRIFRFLALTSVVLTLSASIATAGKPVQNPPPPKPVLYQTQFWTVLGADSIDLVYDTNNKLQSVGSCNVSGDSPGVRAFLYDPSVDKEVGVDLNLLVSNIPAGWSIRKATAINEVGQIAAYIEPTTAPLAQLQPIMIDLNQTPVIMYTVPDRGFTDYSLPGDINDWGDIVVRYRRGNGSFGHYIYNFDPTAGFPQPVDMGVVTTNTTNPRVNNSRELVGSVGNYDGYRWSWTGSFERFPALTPLAISNAGPFCGSQMLNERKGSTTAFQYGPPLEVVAGFRSARDINNSRDLLCLSSLVHRDHGNFLIKDLLDPTDPDTVKVTTLYIWTMTDRDPVTNFPTLTGQTGGVGVLLIPVKNP